MGKKIYVVDDSKEFVNTLKNIFTDHMEFKFKNIKTKDIDKILKDIPELIVVYEDGNKEDVTEICSNIRNDEDNSITPIIVISSNTDKRHITKVLRESVEYYIPKPINEKILYYTIKNITRLMYVNRGVSPLTRTSGKCADTGRN